MSRLCCLLLPAVIALGCASAPRTAPQPPNVVLILVDDLGWMDLGYQGNDYYHTPNIDRLSRQGVVFSDGYAAASNCAPSRAALMTGRYAPRTGVYTVDPPDRGNDKTRRLIPSDNSHFPPDSIELLSEYLHRNGYRTGTFGKWHIGEDPLRQGFDVNVGGASDGNPRGTYFSPYNIPNITDGPEGEYLPNRLTSEAIRFVDASDDGPFFLYLPYYTVHGPLQAPDTTIARYLDSPDPPQKNKATYRSMVEHMDRNVGRLLHHLDSTGLSENTVVIFTSDNGGVDGYADQDPLRAGKGTYYEGGTRVPLIVRWPGRIAPRSDTTPVINLDFYPTLVALTGGSPPRGELDGADLSGLLLDNAALPERSLYWHFPIYLQSDRRHGDQTRDALFRTRPGSTLRRDRWKLHEYFEDGAVELFDLAADPGEENDLSADRPEVTERLLRDLRAWRQRVGAPVPTERNPGFDASFEAKARAEAEEG